MKGTMRKMNCLLSAFVVAVAFSGCLKIDTPENWTKEPEKEPETESEVYKVVAHRGGAAECNRPDNSVSGLKYAISIKCYASECDIVLTSDNEVLVAHPVDGGKVNGVTTFDHTAAQIRAAGALANGEQIPSLSDFLKVLTDKEQNPHGTKLWMDVKRLVSNGKNMDAGYSINCCLRACQIIREMKAEEYCEFLIPTGEDIFMAVRDQAIDSYKINLAWMTCTDPARYRKAWAQLAYTKILGENPTGNYRPQDYFSAGVPLSIYNVDSDETMDDAIGYYKQVKAIFTNYPAKLIGKLKEKGLEK